MFRNLILGALLFGGIGAFIIVSYLDKLPYYSLDSPYVAAFTAIGIAVGLIFAMISTLIENYENKLYDGQSLVVLKKD